MVGACRETKTAPRVQEARLSTPQEVRENLEDIERVALIQHKLTL